MKDSCFDNGAQESETVQELRHDNRALNGTKILASPALMRSAVSNITSEAWNDRDQVKWLQRRRIARTRGIKYEATRLIHEDY